MKERECIQLDHIILNNSLSKVIEYIVANSNKEMVTDILKQIKETNECSYK